MYDLRILLQEIREAEEVDPDGTLELLAWYRQKNWRDAADLLDDAEYDETQAAGIKLAIELLTGAKL